ncbi:hypothetical protein [Flavobacterium terrigena]|uniref:Uncharacterized protein n=1 Tax=Flavobacterium terrigena TaxID=402734 RepID=A0A1H6S4X6_9FLAO|nr:hypothetical protein [Flavobacterium terrigena]SEI63198.1 hypothetical protein SAMN05660918_1216 [Flavobacterium terrigena]
MITKEEIKATMEVLLDTFPKLKKDIIEDRTFDIRKEKNGWICFIRTKHSQFGEQPGLITTVFDSEGNPTEISVFDFGRARKYYLTKDGNGNIISKD